MNGIASVFNAVFDMISDFGRACTENAALLFNSVFRRPLKFIYVFIRRLLRFIFRMSVLFFAPSDAPSGKYADDVTRAAKQCFRVLLTHPGSFFYVAAYYLKKAKSRYSFTPATVTMWLLPAICAVILVAGLGAFSQKQLALEISLGGDVIGYTANENDFIAARNKAEKLLGSKESTLSDITYRLTFIDADAFTDTDTVCERLLEKNQADTVFACALFSNGRQLAVLYSENDIRDVLSELLSEKKADSRNYTVSFGKEIELRQGLYSAEDIISADELRQLLRSDDESGSILGIREVRTEVVGESIDFDTVEIKSAALYSGSTRVLSQGQKGYAQVTNFVTYINGERVSATEAARLTVVESLPQTVQVGTKPLDEAYSNSMGGIFLWPIVGAYGINSDYGTRWGKLHAGLDLGMGNEPGTSLGKNIIAVAAGTVKTAAVHSSYGYYLIIDHGNGLQTLYAHCLADSFMVTQGQTVVAGQPIARVGSTGYSTGPHLHFEVRVNGNRVNPRPYLGI